MTTVINLASECGDIDGALTTIKLPKRIAIVTGAAKGIGRKIAEALVIAGAQVVSVDISEAVEIPPVAGTNNWKGIKGDISDPQSVGLMIDKCLSEFGPPDILINVAGISTPCLIQDMPFEQWNRMIEVNLNSVFLCTHAVLPHMIKQKRGCIISFSSAVVHQGHLGVAHYAATKGGIEGFSKCLSKEVGQFGITVNVIAPGMIDTDMLALMDGELKSRLIKRLPLRRVGKPEDFVGPILLLVSDLGSYITGQVIHVNGGMV